MLRESRETGQIELDEEESEILSNVFELRSLRETVGGRAFAERHIEPARLGGVTGSMK